MKFCGKTFKYYPPLLYHKKVEHSSEPREFQCSYCEKTFVVKRERMLHERTHTGGKSSYIYVLMNGSKMYFF